MSYLVLARKYRPRHFDDLVGQGHVAKTLTNALTAGRIAHSYVLSGPRGCGKTTTARILARALNCVQGPTLTPCGECPQCRDIAGGTSSDDVLEIDGASNRGIDQIRELRETVKYAPARSRYRVIIIDEAHQISKDGFNALLKTLEEPPPHVVFLMATTESQKIPETILSRCQRFQLRAITATDIVDRLRWIVGQEKLSLDDSALREVARSAHGSLRDALSLLDQVIAFTPQGATAEDVRGLLGLLPGEFVRRFSDTLLAGEAGPVLQAVQTAVDDGLDLSQLAEDLLEHRHRTLLWKAGVRDTRAPDAEEWERESTRFSMERLERDLGVLSRTVAELRRSESPRVTFELACLEMAPEAVSVAELVDRLETLEKKFRAGGHIPATTSRPPAPVRPASVPAEMLAPAAASPVPVRLMVESALPAKPISRPALTPAAAAPMTAPPPQTAEWGAETVRSAWALTVNEVGQKKPSLETFLHNARWSALPGNILKLGFDNDFQKSQVAGQEKYWLDLLKQRLAVSFTVQYAVEPAAAGSVPVARAPTNIPTPAPALSASAVDEEAEVESNEGEPAHAGPVVEGMDDSPEDVAAQDPGVRKVLEKFPGRLRRAAP